MTLTTLLAYATALFIAAAIPGPGMTAIVARALGSGFGKPSSWASGWCWAT